MHMTRDKIAKLAYLTRRCDRHRNPIAHRLSRWWLRRRCHRKKHKPTGRFVMPYEGGLICLEVSDKIGYQVMFGGHHDVGMARVLRRLVRPGDICIDIGANIGVHTLIMAFAAGAGGRVIAVEPSPEVVANLRANVALNRLDNVCVIEAAIAEEDGEAAFYTFDADAPNRMVSSLQPYDHATRQSRVRTICGPTLLETAEVTRCEVLKIDCVGAEMVALKGFAGLITQSRPHVFVEYRFRAWDRFGNRIEEAVELLRSHGYLAYIIKDGLTFPLEGSVPDNCNLYGVPVRDATATPAPAGEGD